MVDKLVNPGAYKKRAGDLSVELDPDKIKRQAEELDQYRGDMAVANNRKNKAKQTQKPFTLLDKYNGF